ncbi:hypothetical protein NONI108955_36800 [Nocardia ninae]|uniref:Uncharacterized protein n=1 Tax=Nocardia ninae NBRC 108245 TaxID=1210091 RepID=A0A511MEY5_9NOCA|nr:hypothetical protein [Nocardia ninae]GEM38648.1 hypothetical protein NN4_31670 [Nocardia ninae NBRC 108245]
MTFALERFGGFVAFSALPVTEVPSVPGVYVVIRLAVADPVFLPTSPAGWFKGKDPSLPVAELQAAWVPGEPVLYIGKAAAGRSGRRDVNALRSIADTAPGDGWPTGADG